MGHVFYATRYSVTTYCATIPTQTSFQQLKIRQRIHFPLRDIFAHKLDKKTVNRNNVESNAEHSHSMQTKHVYSKKIPNTQFTTPRHAQHPNQDPHY